MGSGNNRCLDKENIGRCLGNDSTVFDGTGRGEANCRNTAFFLNFLDTKLD